MNKKILSSALAAMMLVSPTYAIEAAGGTGDVPVHLTQDATQFSVTVPTVLPVDVSAEVLLLLPMRIKSSITHLDQLKSSLYQFNLLEIGSWWTSIQISSLRRLVCMSMDFK